MIATSPCGRLLRATLLLLMAFVIVPLASAGQRAKAVEWGVYAELAGTSWTASGGFPRKAWRWSSDGSSILEIEQRKPGAATRITTIKGAQKGGKLVAVGPDGRRSKGTVDSDGSVIWTGEGFEQGSTRIAVQGGVLVEQGVKLKDGRPKKVTDETRFARSNDQSWADVATGGKGKGKGAGGYQPAPSQSSPPSNVVVPPIAPPVANTPAPAAGGNDSLDCMMQSAAVRATGCKPPSANTGSTPAKAPVAGAQALMVDGQLVDVSRSFPPNILGTYLYEKRGEPIIELRGDGTGRFQAHMIAPIAIRWWLKSSPTGVPDKVTGRNGNYRYTVVLQYLNSTNGNYPSGSYASWYLDTDVAAGCSIILGERFKCR